MKNSLPAVFTEHNLNLMNLKFIEVTIPRHTNSHTTQNSEHLISENAHLKESWWIHCTEQGKIKNLFTPTYLGNMEYDASNTFKTSIQ